MRPTKKLTVSAAATALGTALMSVGAVWELMDLSLVAFASLFIMLILIEVGGAFPWMVWLATSLLTFFIFPKSPISAVYFAFGVFPILKYYIEKLKRPFWILLKLAYSNICILGIIFLMELVFKRVVFDTDLLILKIALYVLFVAAFFAYDRMLTLMSRVYLYKLRHRFRNLFK